MPLENLKKPTIEREYFSEKELSELTGFPRSWFQQCRTRSQGIPYTKFGDGKFAPVRYHIADVEKWIAEHSAPLGTGDD